MTINEQSAFAHVASHYTDQADGRSQALGGTYRAIADLDTKIPVKSHALAWACDTLAAHYVDATGPDASRAATLLELKGLLADDMPALPQGGVALFGDEGSPEYHHRITLGLARREVVDLWRHVGRTLGASSGLEGDAWARACAIGKRWRTESDVLVAALLA